VSRYDNPALFRRCGRSGIKLPQISLGFWHNFGAESDYANSRALVLAAFDRGITHFDLANNYGPPVGAAESTFGRILREDLAAHRHEIVIATKAGYAMWPGPYGDWGSRKYLLTSLEHSLRRLGVEAVDIFYSHRPDPETPLEETMGALAHAVRAGQTLYTGISNYDPKETRRAARLLRESGSPCLIHQQRYSMFSRDAEKGLFPALEEEGIGAIAFCPLAQGLLTNRYLAGIPADARAARDPRFLRPEHITSEKVARARKLDGLATARGQSLAQMALAWVLRQPAVTSALIGASKVAQIEENLGALDQPGFSPAELAEIEAILAG
jgi:L-glyceraldehyde 3-phosphate reductase